MHLNSTVKQILIWVFMITCLICLWQFVVKGAGMGQDRTDSLTQFMNDADQGKIADVVVNGSEVTGHYRDEKGQFHVTIPANGYQDMYKTLREHGTNITVKDPNANFWVSTLISIAPFALLLGLWFFLLRQMQSGGNKAMSFGKSPRPSALHAAEEDHLQGCRWRRRSQGRA